MNEENPPHATRLRRGMIQCPHCNADAIIRTSEQQTPLHKDIYLICSNADCGHTWKAQISAVHSLSPSAIPNPEINLPPAPTDYQRKRFPSTAREPGCGPGHPDQITIFDYLANEQAA